MESLERCQRVHVLYWFPGAVFQTIVFLMDQEPYLVIFEVKIQDFPNNVFLISLAHEQEDTVVGFYMEGRFVFFFFTWLQQ